MKKTIGTFFFAGIVGLATLNVEGKTVLPNPRFTSPHFCTVQDRDFKELRYESKTPVCRRNVSSSRKSKIYDAYQIPKEERSNYTVDHLIPLSMGGSNHNKNLWPQPKSQTTAPIEYKIYVRIRNGELTIQEGWNLILGEKYGDEI